MSPLRIRLQDPPVELQACIHCGVYEPFQFFGEDVCSVVHGGPCVFPNPNVSMRRTDTGVDIIINDETVMELEFAPRKKRPRLTNEEEPEKVSDEHSKNTTKNANEEEPKGDKPKPQKGAKGTKPKPKKPKVVTGAKVA